MGARMTAQVVPLFDDPDLSERRRLLREAREKGQGFPYVQLKASDFQSFWKIYPRRDNRAGAEREWIRLGAPLRVACMRALPAIVEFWEAKGTHSDYIPHPRNFLRDRRWEDEQFKQTDLGGCCFNRGPFKTDESGECGERATVKGNPGSPYTGGVYCRAHAERLQLVRRKA